MRLEDFLLKAIRHGVIISSITDKGWAWGAQKRYAELTSLIDFECNFDEAGICKVYQPRKTGPKGGKRSKALLHDLSKCCCRGCWRRVGYLKALPNHTSELSDIAELFNEETGFWRSGKGCVLPREYRSNTCLFHMCRRKPSKSRPGDPLELLRDMMRTPCEPDYLHKYSKYPKTFRSYSRYRGKSVSRKWISPGKMKEMILKDNDRRKKKEASNGNN